MQGLHIAVIDDGVHTGKYPIGELVYDLEIDTDLRIKQRIGYDHSYVSHGTTCAAIIKKYCPDAPISSIRILNDRRRGECRQLVKALYWCADNGIRLVNLSLGSTQCRDYSLIREAVNYAYSKGLIIVAASNNKGYMTYPASLSSVIGVKSFLNERSYVSDAQQASLVRSADNPRHEYVDYSPDGIEVIVSALHELTDSEGRRCVKGRSNSFSAPYITSVVYDILRNMPALSLEQVKAELRNQAVHSKNFHRPWLYKTVDWVKRAVVINICANECLQKDGRSEKFLFDIVNETSFEFITMEITLRQLNEFLQNIFSEEWDTMILRADSGVAPALREQSREIITALLSMTSKNIVYLDDGELESTLDIPAPVPDGVKIWHPSVYRHLKLEPCKTKMTDDIPALSILDLTGNHLAGFVKELQGLFREEGYHCLAVTDQCEGILSGMEYLPPIVSDSGVAGPNLPLLEELCRIHSPDVLLLGVSRGCGDSGLLTELEACVEPDIRIILTDEDALDGVEEFLLSNLHNETLVVLFDAEGQRALECFPKVRIFPYHENTTAQVHRHILALYASDGEE